MSFKEIHRALRVLHEDPEERSPHSESNAPPRWNLPLPIRQAWPRSCN